ncbi:MULTISPECIES: M3 family metallopeptidase [unclassified Nocardioides]|uniref:M3 family metallopeptidase n=1 Tax=unclassified Nocardioides TaxID=2615069 RepID=UPI0009F0960F|nr:MULTISPECIES: M3 family metallopeptidase [unclassified Nocardioides]GAW49809.1 thimet oligopeptidase [Nocardioides sp. PD653-B2]GAW57149.1 thimet oligopeptidase [Nocardioides sp. PD653]
MTAPLALPSNDDAPAWVETRTRDGLAEARVLVDRLRDDPPADALGVLRQWDEVGRVLSNIASVGSLLANVHPDEAVRTSCEQAEVEVDRLVTELRQDRALYDVFAGLDADGLDPVAARLLTKTLEDFRRAGVDLDDATRARLTEINERLTAVGQEFSRTIRDDVRTVRVTPDRLAGLPQDWLDAHPAGDDGLVTVTTDYPDAVPVRMFAHDPDVRRQVTVAFLERGWPQNESLLGEMFALRHELANLVGYADFASYDADVKMIGKGPAIPEFIDRIAEAADAPMRRDLESLLARYRQDVPDATEIDTADSLYYEELVRKEQHDVDAQLVRTYFDFTRVRQGLLDVTARLFGLRYEPVPDATVWHEDVTAYDVFSGDETLGRIYLDLHPRDGKYKHAAQFTVADGLAGRQLAEGALVCNFSRGLMEHDHVVTLFHEFGHLVHHVLAGRGEWTRFSGVATEWDFVEAPSQMLEEWAWDADILRSFATNANGEPIPADLVERMRAADDFGKGYQARTQMFYAAMSYWFHTDRPADLTAAMRELQARYSPFAYIEGTHMFASFGHLGGYSSAYYTYMWSLVIAKDLFSAFDPDDLFDAEVAGRYRDRVLAPGGSKDAADLVADFLGRPYTFDAYAAWLAR